MAGGYGSAPSTFSNILGSAAKGAMGGAAGGPAGMLAGAGLSIIPSIFGAIEGIGQRRQAKRIRANAVNPGYVQNAGVLQNKDILENRYNNYSLPGMSQQLNNIGTNAATAFGNSMQGASSSGDVLDAATRIAYGTGQQQNDLMLQQAQGKEGALGGFLNANAAAGQEAQDANAYDRQLYMQQLNEAAALYGAGGENINNATIGAGSIGASLLMNQAIPGTNTRSAPITQRAQMAGVNNVSNPYPNSVLPNSPLPPQNITRRGLYAGVTNNGIIPYRPIR